MCVVSFHSLDVLQWKSHFMNWLEGLLPPLPFTDVSSGDPIASSSHFHFFSLFNADIHYIH